MFKSPESALLPRGSQLGGWAMKLSGPLEKAQVSPICGQRKKGPSWFVAIAHAPPAFDGQSAVVMASGVFRQSERIGHLSGVILPDRQRNKKNFFCSLFLIFFLSLSLALFIIWTLSPKKVFFPSLFSRVSSHRMKKIWKRFLRKVNERFLGWRLEGGREEKREGSRYCSKKSAFYEC